MLEKIGLPAKPALRGNNWVVDASHCQGCSSQFTFINRKHHCRRCGGLFCNSCTQQRIVLRGQGDSPVRICEPCKKLEEAARFEMRHGHKNRARRGGSKLTSRYEDEVLNQILGNDGKELVSSERGSAIDMVSSIQSVTSSASCSNIQEVTTQDEGGEILRSLSIEESSHVLSEMGSTTPEELRQQAQDEKKKYKILKAEGKSEEALRAFKRGKELERQAGALELLLRKNRKRVLSSSNMTEIPKIKDDPKDSGRKNKFSSQISKEKDDLTSELRELGWSDMDLHDAGKKPASMSLEGELSTLLGEVSQKTNTEKGTRGVDKTQIIAHKKKALALKREGKLAEAKEELKRAKVLEKQLEDQEILAEAEDSDDELSSLIRSVDVGKQDDLSVGYEPGPGLDFDNLLGLTDDLGVNSNFEVTDEDMDDPEIAAALTSLGWTEEANHTKDIEPQFAPIDRDALLSEIQSLKREALNQKRAGNTAEAMSLLKKAKILEKDVDNYDSQGTKLMAHNSAMVQKGSTSQSAENPSKPNKMDIGNASGRKDTDPKLAPKSRLIIQKELLGLKKRALALRREGRLDEADEELKKGKVLEQQLEEMDNSSNLKVTQVNVSNKRANNSIAGDLGDEGEGNVTDQDLHDPTYLSLLRNLGWKDEDNENVRLSSKPTKQNDNLSMQISDSSVTQAPTGIQVGASRRGKGEIQRELLGLKRKALSLRRQGETEEAEEVLKMAKVLEDQLAEIEAPKKEAQDKINTHMGNEISSSPLEKAVDDGDEGDVSEEDMHDPALVSMLKNLGWKDEVETVSMQAKPSKEIASNSGRSDEKSVIQSSTEIVVVAPKRSKLDIQKDLLSLKRKALSLRRQGETEEAEEVLRKAKLLEAQMEEGEAPKKEIPFDASNDKERESFGPLLTDEKHQSLKDVVEVNKVTLQAAVDPNEKVERPMGLGWKEIDIDKLPPPPRSSDISIHETSQSVEEKHPLLVELGPPGEMKIPEDTDFIHPRGQSANIMDLLTGDDWRSSQVSVQNFEDKQNFSSVISSLANSPIQLGSQKSSIEGLGSKDNVTCGKREEIIHVNEKPHIDESNPSQVTLSQNDQSSLRQEILSHKRKAVALKREGKLAEAREELRQAKLLEKNLEDNNPQPSTSSRDVSTSTANVMSAERKEHSSSNLAPKPMSSRDRFKLQQESLSHKRQALKLRREGRMEEADAEFELAKALESKLEELAAHNSTKSSVSGAEPVDDVGVEDLLDPQLLSALKAIGLEDTSFVSQGTERLEPAKSIAGNSETSNQERIQLEERIKAEKVKAVNLKRSGKQAEALDALRRAKQLEKKLNS
uniref:FYVE-type domain-containing protein n=1 Tax=Davidia involucrata TaxID=16924 RepID=A0A5B7CG03_DAVIN